MKILIVGAGDVGLQLAKQLSQRHDLTLIEADHKKAVSAANLVDAILVEGNACSPSVQRKADFSSMDMVAAMTSTDEVNILACEMAKQAGVTTTICRVRNYEFIEDETRDSFCRMGVDFMIHPERETANEIIQLIKQQIPSNAISVADGRIQLTGLVLMRESPLVRIPLKDLRAEFSDFPFRIVSVLRKDKTFILGGNDILFPGDKIFVLCEPQYAAKVIAMAGKEKSKIHDIMLLGGGLVSQFVGLELGGKYNIKIIESSEAKSEHIAQLLPETLIIHGDGTDIDLLGVEGIIDMDVFIATTGSDEVNIISTLVARHLEVGRTIALVNNVEYMPITPTIGMDAVVSKELITVNAVLRFIRHKQAGAISTIPGIETQVIEYTAGPKAKITKKTLKDIKFPKRATVAAILKADEVIITHGDSQILPGDQVVVFALPEVRGELDRLFG
jgi:trk system potassium uptake protein TrkA